MLTELTTVPVSGYKRPGYKETASTGASTDKEVNKWKKVVK